MPSTPHSTRALVRHLPATFDDCIKPPETKQPIDLALAREQHRGYRDTLQSLGLELIEIGADDAYPDCVFVEDTAIIAGETAVLSRFGVEARSGEENAVGPVLDRFKRVVKITSPATVEGGDVLKIDATLYVGVSSRTNSEGVTQLRSALAPAGFTVVPVPVTGVFHLKSAVTYLGDEYIAISQGFFDEMIFSRYKKIVVPPGELYATNCLAVNDSVLVSAGYPATRELIESAGFHTASIETSEFRKAGGSLTCLSILL